MKVFFDNCTSHVLASTLDGFIRHEGHEAHHIKDLPCGSGASDSEWIRFLSATPEEWIVVSGDGRFRRNKAERVAYRRAGLRGFVLAPAYQTNPDESMRIDSRLALARYDGSYADRRRGSAL